MNIVGGTDIKYENSKDTLLKNELNRLIKENTSLKVYKHY